MQGPRQQGWAHKLRKPTCGDMRKRYLHMFPSIPHGLGDFNNKMSGALTTSMPAALCWNNPCLSGGPARGVSRSKEEESNAKPKLKICCSWHRGMVLAHLPAHQHTNENSYSARLVFMMIVRSKLGYCSGVLALLAIADRHFFAGLDVSARGIDQVHVCYTYTYT